MSEVLLLWRFLEADTHDIKSGTCNREGIDIASSSVERIMIRGFDLLTRANCLYSINPLEKIDDEYVFGYHYNRYSAKILPKPFATSIFVPKTGVLVRVWFNGFDLKEQTYPYLDLVMIDPTVDKVKMDKGYVVKAQLKEGVLTGKSTITKWKARPKKSDVIASFEDFNEFFEAYANQ